jgi:hypothetical protein
MSRRVLRTVNEKIMVLFAHTVRPVQLVARQQQNRLNAGLMRLFNNFKLLVARGRLLRKI